jgi:hypothetical protein
MRGRGRTTWHRPRPELAVYRAVVQLTVAVILVAVVLMVLVSVVLMAVVLKPVKAAGVLPPWHPRMLALSVKVRHRRMRS